MEQERELSASEALYGFAGWITSRIIPITASGHHDAAVWAEMVDDFCKANGLEEPKSGWEISLSYPTTERASRDDIGVCEDAIEVKSTAGSEWWLM